MSYPTFEQASIYKSRNIQSQIRAAIAVDYPVFSGHFEDDFDGLGLPDSNKWFIFNPSWGLCTQWVGALWVGSDVASIAPSWVQSRHNLAFPMRRDTDWTFQIRAAATPITGYGAFIRICGRSFRDCESIFGIKANTADGLEVHAPDGFSTDAVLWGNGNDQTFNRYRVRYDHINQNYIIDIDANDDGTYEVGPFTVAVNGRYAEAIVIGNSTAIQGLLGAWTEWHVDWVDVVGTAESVIVPGWASPFEHDSERFAYLPTLLGGRVSCDKKNLIDAATLELDNFGVDEELEELRQLYTNVFFLNRRAFVEGRAGDGAGNWAPWEMLFEGRCAEKEVELQEGRCSLSLPMRDRWRAIADDLEVIYAYSDAPDTIAGMGMNMTVAEIIEDLYQSRCGMPASSHNVLATPNNSPRNYNIFRKSAQQAIKKLCEDNAMAIYQRRSDARIEVQDWPWGTDTPQYQLTTEEEIRFVRWLESALEMTSGEQLGFENTDYPAGGFTATWPPHRTPYYGRLTKANAVTCQTSAEHDARPLTALKWWVRNRYLGGLEISALAQFWVEHNLELSVHDNRFLGYGKGEFFMLDGWTHQWSGEETARTQLKVINTHPDKFWGRNLAT